MRWPRCTLACPDQSFGPAASPAGCPAAILCAGRLCCRLDRPRFAFSGWAWSRPIIAPRFSGPLGVLTRCRGPCAPLGFRLPSEFAVSRIRGGTPPLPVAPGGQPPAFLFGFRAAEVRPFESWGKLVPEILLLIKPKNNSFPPKIAVGNLSDLLHTNGSRHSSVFLSILRLPKASFAIILHHAFGCPDARWHGGASGGALGRTGCSGMSPDVFNTLAHLSGPT